MRKLASIRTIHEINPIAGADKIEVAQIDGWESVVRKGQKREGVVMRNEKRNISFKVINPDFLLSEK